MDYKKINNVQVEGIDYKDAPDFCDAFIFYAELDGVPMTDEQIEELNNDSDFVHDCVQNYIY